MCVLIRNAATASYRLLPHISLGPNPIPRGSAAKFAACFSPGVIRVDPKTQVVSVDERAVRGESMSREVFRHPEFEGCVKLGRVRDHFLCELKKVNVFVDARLITLSVKVESEGAYAPERLFIESVKVLRGKIAVVRAAALRLQDGAGTGEEGDVTMEDA
jgi:DNA-directed RNA polymerase I and III subunit RPAC1